MFFLPVWKGKNVSIFLFITLLSKIGDKVYLIGMPWLVYDLTGSALGMGGMFFVETLPYIFMSPLAGILADRLSRKNLMSLTSLLQGLCIGTVIVLHLAGVLNIYQIYTIGFILSCATATYMVLNDTVIPQLFENKDLEKANSFVQLIETSTLLFGASIGGLLIGTIGIYGLLWVIAIAYIGISPIAFMLQISPFEGDEVVEQKSSIENLYESLRYVIKHSVVGPLVLLNTLANVTAASIEALLIFFMRHSLALPPKEVGLIYGVGGLAELIGIILIPIFKRLNVGVITIMLSCQFVFAAGVIWTALSTGWITLAMGIAVQNVCIVIYNVFSRTIRQRVIPEVRLGRVNGVFLMIGQSTYPLAGFLGSAFAQSIGVPRVWICVGIFTILTAVIFWFSSLRKNEFSAGETVAEV